MVRVCTSSGIGGSFLLVIENLAADVADELEGSAAQILQRLRSDIAPIGFEGVEVRRDSAMEQLQHIARCCVSIALLGLLPCPLRRRRRRLWDIDRRQIVSQPLERPVAHQAGLGLGAVVDFRLQDRSHPRGLGFVDHLVQRRRLLDKGIERLADLLCFFQRVAAFDLAAVEQLLAHSAADVKGGDAPWLGAELLDEGDDREVVGQPAFGLHPGSLTPRLVGRIGLL
jgi:hypothetical protein